MTWDLVYAGSEAGMTWDLVYAGSEAGMTWDLVHSSASENERQAQTFSEIIPGPIATAPIYLLTGHKPDIIF